MARTSGADGTIRIDARGRYRALLPPRLSPTGQRKSLPGSWDTKTEARKALNKAIADIEDGRRVAPTRTKGQPVRRVKHAVAEYIDARASDPRAPLSVHTERGYRSDLANHICRPAANMGDTPLDKLTPQHVQTWMDDLGRDGVGTGTAEAAKRLLSAALNWEMAAGRIARNPVGLARKASSKFSRANEQSADVVLLPSWKEAVALICHPEREEDRLLLALMMWTGLRWSEAISLEAVAVWRDRPLLTIGRVLVKRTQQEVAARPGATWVEEPPKAGLTATIPVPTKLWRQLVRLAGLREQQDPLPVPAGRLLFTPANIRLTNTTSIGAWDNTNFREKVWIPAREAVGLVGDDSLPVLDPRRQSIKIKDLRAFAASVLLDSDASMTEAATLLRHSTTSTTEKHYARAMSDKAHDAARRSVVIDASASLHERLDALWGAFETAHPGVCAALGIAPPDDALATTEYAHTDIEANGKSRGHLRLVM